MSKNSSDTLDKIRKIIICWRNIDFCTIIIAGETSTCCTYNYVCRNSLVCVCTYTMIILPLVVYFRKCNTTINDSKIFKRKWSVVKYPTENLYVSIRIACQLFSPIIIFSIMNVLYTLISRWNVMSRNRH